jgi:hypothetical protein
MPYSKIEFAWIAWGAAFLLWITTLTLARLIFRKNHFCFWIKALLTSLFTSACLAPIGGIIHVSLVIEPASFILVTNAEDLFAHNLISMLVTAVSCFVALSIRARSKTHAEIKRHPVPPA